MKDTILWWFWVIVRILLVGLGIFLIFMFFRAFIYECIIIKEEYKKQYSYELKGINNKEYEYNKSNGYYIIAYANYTSKNEYEEYYILWQNTAKGLEKVKLKNKNVYLIESNDGNPRIEYYIKYTTNKNGREEEWKNDFYYQIYIPENSIDYSYELN